MGSGFNTEYVQATQYQADKNAEISTSSNKADLEIAKEQSRAVIEQAKVDADIRRYEADQRVKVEMEALRVREKEAELTFRTEMRQAENDAIRAQATQTAAGAKATTADSKILKEKRKAERDRARSDEGNFGLGYYYG